MAAQILGYENYFLLNGNPARYDLQEKKLIPYVGDDPPKATRDDILSLYETRILTRLTNDQGALFTFEEAGLNEESYLEDYEKIGYSHLPYKLLYIVKENALSSTPYGYVIPVNGYGLWDAIYGYLGIEGNGDTVLGMTWYDQKETPGLGGEIGLPEWQEQFAGKVIFQKSPDEEANFARDPLRIQVVKTTVQEVYGDSTLSKSAVDGIPGASITVHGVNEALSSSLAPYRPFLIRAHNGEIKIDG